MTDQHPLTDEICEELSSWHIDVLDPGLADDIRNDIRAGADWQLAQVISWLLYNIDDRYKRQLENNLSIYKKTDAIIYELEAAMRPQQQKEKPMSKQDTFATITYNPPRIIATWDLFGGKKIVIEFTEHDEIPNRWIRFWSKLFFNSKWEFHND